MKSYKDAKSAYNIEFGISMTIYVISIIGGTFLIGNLNPPLFIKYIIAIIPSLAIGGQIIAYLRFINHCDEFLKAAMAKIFIISTGITLFLCSFWGFLENFNLVSHIELWIVYVIFWFSYGVVTLLGKFVFKSLDTGLCG